MMHYEVIDEINSCLYDFHNLICLYDVQRSYEDKGLFNVYGNKVLQLCKTVIYMFVMAEIVTIKL